MIIRNLLAISAILVMVSGCERFNQTSTETAANNQNQVTAPATSASSVDETPTAVPTVAPAAPETPPAATTTDPAGVTPTVVPTPSVDEPSAQSDSGC